MSAPLRRRHGLALLERDDELAAIGEALDDACGEVGALVVIEAPAGIGKTRLVQAAARAARERAMTELVARGQELEREFSFGVVRQLFEAPLLRAGAPERAQLLSGAAELAGDLLLGVAVPRAPVTQAAVDHALYWLVANFAAQGPLALVVDDGQWADAPSLRALLHVIARLEDLRVAIVVATRPPDGTSEVELLGRLSHHPLALQLRPRPLSASAVGALVGGQLGGADDDFARACHAASAGNPFMISELIAAIAAAELAPTAGNASQVRAIGPQTVARSVLLRLNGQPAEAGALARALAILGGNATLAQVARAAGLDEPVAGRTADALAAIDILAPGRPLEFAHPIVRTAVYESLPASARSAGHAAAARQLHARGGSAESVAAHLLHCEPAGDDWAVDRLYDAALAATATGALGGSVAYLERALAEPAPAGLRPRLLLALSDGYRHRHEWERSAAALREVLALAEDAVLRADAARRLAALLLVARRHDEASATLAPVVTAMRATDPQLALTLELSLSSAMWLDTDRAPAMVAAVRALPAPGGGADARERVVLSRRAWAALVAGEPAQEVAQLARAALSSGELIAEDARAHGFEMSVVALALSGELGGASELLARAMDVSRERGHTGRWGLLSAVAAHVHLLRGRLADAEELALQALDALRADGIAFPAALDALTDALLERGNVAAARHLHAHLADDGRLPDPMLLAGLRIAPARLALAAGDAGGALEQLAAIGARQLALERPNPAWCAWRSTAALVHLQNGDRAAAAALAEEELALARAFGADRALGVALRAVGICRGGHEGIALLEEASAVLAGSGAELEHARALVDLGAMRRRAGERGDAARGPLRQGREIAERLGATVLAERARAELLAAGARPRRTALRGAAALTPAERRVCELAVGGMSNRAIAQALFVTIKTVEGHLASSYRKLDIARKQELPSRLITPHTGVKLQGKG